MNQWYLYTTHYLTHTTVLLWPLTLKMKALHSFNMMGTTRPITVSHPSRLYSSRCSILISYNYNVTSDTCIISVMFTVWRDYVSRNATSNRPNVHMMDKSLYSTDAITMTEHNQNSTRTSPTAIQFHKTVVSLVYV